VSHNKRWIYVLGTLSVSALLLSGCAASSVPGTTATPTGGAVSAAESCGQFGDVLTILQNARVSFTDGRSSQQEYTGAARLAARVLERIPGEPGTDIAKALEELRTIAPAGDIGDVTASYDPEGAAWSDAVQDLIQACSAEGADVAVSAWTGG
jgi:hypothetical protein